jgi:hypothetical protein
VAGKLLDFSGRLQISLVVPPALLLFGERIQRLLARVSVIMIRLPRLPVRLLLAHTNTPSGMVDETTIPSVALLAVM